MARKKKKPDNPRRKYAKTNLKGIEDYKPNRNIADFDPTSRHRGNAPLAKGGKLQANFSNWKKRGPRGEVTTTNIEDLDEDDIPEFFKK